MIYYSELQYIDKTDLRAGMLASDKMITTNKSRYYNGEYNTFAVDIVGIDRDKKTGKKCYFKIVVKAKYQANQGKGDIALYQHLGHTTYKTLASLKDSLAKI